METINTEINGRIFELELQPVVFEVWKERNTLGRHCLILAWRRETQFANIIQLRMIVFHLGPPWFHHSCSILDREEPISDDEK